MPDYKETSRYSIPDPTNPTIWRDLTVSGDDAEFDVEGVREDTKLYRVLIPKGTHLEGSEFPLFKDGGDDRSEMDTSWSGDELPRREVGIVHRVGVAISPFVCDEPTEDEDIAKVLANAYLSVSSGSTPIVEGSLETLPIGFGVAGGTVSNGFPAADAVPERYPQIFTNPAMRWEGKLSFPHRKWLHGAVATPSTNSTSGTGDGDSDTDTINNCDDSGSSSNKPCVRLRSNVLVTFYMTGVFGRVRESSEG